MTKFDKVLIIGTGLMGASLGMTLVQQRLAKEVVGVGRRAANLRTAKRRRAITHMLPIKRLSDLLNSHHLTDADLIILATPVRTIETFLQGLRPALIKKMKRGAIVTDVGSTKQGIVKLAQRRCKDGVHFVGGHPIAGTEFSGAAAARKDLFHDSVVVLTPSVTTNKVAVTKVRALWKQAGATVKTMSPRDHDHLLAVISHLPHMAAYSLVNTLRRPGHEGGMAAGGFRGTTRIASSDPVMWRDICLDNREELLRAMGRFEKEWQHIKRAIRKRDGVALQKFFTRGKKTRDKYLG